MISIEKWYILTPLQKMPKNVGDLGKFIVAKGFEKLPKVQKNRPIWSHCLGYSRIRIWIVGVPKRRSLWLVVHHHLGPIKNNFGFLF